MLFLTKFSDIKAILALFNFAYEYKTGEQEKHVQQMSERLLETQPDKVLKQLYADFAPFVRVLTSAIRSLSNCFTPRLVKAQNWTEVKFLDILHEPDKLSHTALTDRMCTQLLSIEVMERWIVICTFYIHPELNNVELYNVWKAAYKNSYVLVLFRDEIIFFHSLAVQFFDTIKNCSKRASEIKELYQTSCSQAPTIHHDRRNYLRLILRQLCQIISDEPGLLGPKSFLVLWALSYATDEVHWLLRHSDNVPAKKGAVINLNSKVNVDEFNDAVLPELLFYIEEIRRLIIRFTEVIQIFYQQILAEYDAPGLKFMVKDVIGRCGQESSIILTSMYQMLVSMENVTERDKLNFSGLRLDWFRAQFYLSIGNSPINLGQNIKLISHINSTIFHTKMIDFLSETVKECADLSIFCFYDKKFQEFYERNITYSSQHRFAIVFPLICTHYINACDESCPEEAPQIAKKSIQNATKCLKNISVHITQLVSQTMDAYCSLSLQLAPKEALFYLCLKNNKKKSKSATLPTKGRSNSVNYKQLASATDLKNMPGAESRRKTRENPTPLDKSLLALTQLCFTINHYREIIVWDRSFVPREILYQELGDMFNEKISRSVEIPMCDNSKGSGSMSGSGNNNGGGANMEDGVRVRQPTEMLLMMQEYMSVLMNVDKHANVEIVRIFTDVFLSQSQLRDSYKGQPTIVAAYIKWYLDTILKFAFKDYFVYSPLLKSFITMPGDALQLPFRAEEYADLNELRALVDIIGPFGMRLLNEAVCQEVAKVVEEKLKKLVIQNKTTLESLRESVHEPSKTRKLTSCLLGVDEMLGALKRVGVLLAFRDLCREAAQDILSARVPFLFGSVRDMQHEYSARNETHLLALQYQQQQQQQQQLDENGELIGGPGTLLEDRQSIYARINEQLIINDICMSMGLKCALDSNLCSALEARRRLQQAAQQASGGPGNGAGGSPGIVGADQEYKVAYLLFTFVAYALPRLARLEGTVYHPELEAHANNSHCLAYAINSLMMVLFSRYGHEELDSREKEFMALTSSNLLRLGLECSGSALLSLESGGAGSGSNVSGSGKQDGGGTSNQTAAAAASAVAKNRYSVYILFDLMTERCCCLTADLREACFPYALIRQAYQAVARQNPRGPAGAYLGAVAGSGVVGSSVADLSTSQQQRISLTMPN